MTEIYLHFLFAHYGLYGNAPVRVAEVVTIGVGQGWHCCSVPFLQQVQVLRHEHRAQPTRDIRRKCIVKTQRDVSRKDTERESHKDRQTRGERMAAASVAPYSPLPIKYCLDLPAWIYERAVHEFWRESS